MRDRATVGLRACRALAVLTVLSRLPFRARMLYNWDGVQSRWHCANTTSSSTSPIRPLHPLRRPGPHRERVAHDPTAAYVLLAVAFSGLTTFVVYLLASRRLRSRDGAGGGQRARRQPAVLVLRLVGLTYAGEALFASSVAYFAFRALDGSEADAWLAAAYLALAAGMRQSLLLLLLPMWLVAACSAPAAPARPIGVAILGALTLLWFVPMVMLTAGSAGISRRRHSSPTRSCCRRPSWPSIRDDAAHVALPAGVGAGRARPLALAVLLVPWYARRHGWGRREWLLLAWIAPPVLVYTLVHFGQAGYVLTFLPALVVLLARVLVTAFAEAAARARRRALGRR